MEPCFVPVSERGAVAVAAVVAVHVDAAAAGGESHAGHEQERHQSKDCFLFHSPYNAKNSNLFFVIEIFCVYLHFILESI